MSFNTASDARESSATVLMGKEPKFTGRKLRSGATRSRHSRMAAVSPWSAISKHLFTISGAWLWSISWASKVVLFRLPGGRPRPNLLPGSKGRPRLAIQPVSSAGR
jgi:hypothetical protein